jgi:hypothetical protein
MRGGNDGIYDDDLAPSRGLYFSAAIGWLIWAALIYVALLVLP